MRALHCRYSPFSKELIRRTLALRFSALDDTPAVGRHARSVALLHARYEQAIRWAVEQALAARGVRVDYPSLVQAIVQERLLVPEEDFRTSGRQIARRFACSTARVWNLEKRLLQFACKHLTDQAGVSHEAATIVCRTYLSVGVTEDASSAVPKVGV